MFEYRIQRYMQYSISRNSSTSQFIQITLNLQCKANEKINLQLASWRPGRYELANYAQKIRGFKIYKGDKTITWKKKTKDLWEFESLEDGIYQIHYEFYANQMDAGGSWSDDEQLYFNFGNFIFEIKGRENEPIKLFISVPEDYLIASPLEFHSENFLDAPSYQHLIDSPFLASKNLKHFTYQVSSSTFHLWFNGEIHFDIEKLTQIFKQFTKAQINAFGEFPAQDYHFIFQLLPYKHYHGVEHQFSTVITFGPAQSLSDQNHMRELIGVSSHELYHFWNVCRIRPKGIITYDLSKEVYLDSGLILEGVTTYMGDLFLLKSGYFNLQEYCDLILTKLIHREFDSLGWQNQSIVDSSFDLWLDGYKAGIPEKKVSIYNRGALISLCLDLMLLKSGSSLSQVMKEMWLQFGKKGLGYTISDFETLIGSEFIEKGIIRKFFEDFVFGTIDILPTLKELLRTVGIRLSEKFGEDNLLHQWGIRTNVTGIIIQIHPKSRAYSHLMIADKIISINGKGYSHTTEAQTIDLKLEVERYGRKVEVKIPYEDLLLFPLFELSITESIPEKIAWID